MSRPPAEPSAFMALPRGFAPLGYRNFALYWIGFAASNSGKWSELTGAVWLLSELTTSPVLLGLIGVFRSVPGIVLGPIAGAVADRVDQRRLLLTTQALAMVNSLAFGLIVLLGLAEIWQLYVQTALQASIETFDGAARQAIFPNFVPRQRRSEAVTLTTTAARTAKFVGPMVGGFCIAGFGPAAPFLVNAGTYLALIAALLLMRGVVQHAAAASSSIRGEIAAGVRHILAAPVLSGLLKMEIAFSLFGINAVIITIVGRQLLDVGPESLGGLVAAPGLGALVGLAYLLTVGHSRRQGRFVILSTLAYAATLVMFGLSVDYVLSFAALALAGLFDVVVSVTRQSIMQLAAPDEMRGRVMANVRVVTGNLSQLGQTQSGVTAALFSGPAALLVAAGTLAIAAVVTARGNRELWALSRDEVLAQVPSSDATIQRL